MAQTPGTLQTLSSAQLAQLYPGYYPQIPSTPAPSPIASAPDLTRPQLAQQHPEFYPDGYSPKVPQMPAPEVDPRQFLPQEALKQQHPEFYDPPKVPVEPIPSGIPKAMGAIPEIPTPAAAGKALGSFIGTPAGGGVIAGVGAGLIGVASGQPLETAAGTGIGTALGATGGAILGSAFGPVGTFVGGQVGAIAGGFIGGNIGQAIHDLFHPPKAIDQSIPAPRKQFPPLTGSRPIHYRVTATGKFKNQEMSHFENVVLGPVTGLVTTSEDGITVYALGYEGGAKIAGYMSGAQSTIAQPVSITGITAIDGSPDPTTASPIPLSPNFLQSPGQGVPFGVDFGPGIAPKSLPPTLPQAQPAPTIGPKMEPRRAPIGISLNPPQYNPAPTPTPTPTPTPDPTPNPDPTPSTPGQGAQTNIQNSGPNLNNVPGLFGLPFIPAVMPSNRPSPSGSLDIDPGSGGTGTGKPPKAPTNSPCSGACQKAIEGRIQGVDDKLGNMLQGGNNAAQDAALAEILRRLAIIDVKLGVQATGGLSGFLGKFRAAFDKLSEWLHLDRLLNIMTFVVTLQNAYFLTDSLKIVTLQMISDGLNVLGFQDKDGNGLNLNKLLDKTIEDMLKKVLGVDTLEGMKKEWKALSRIYQAGSNIIYAFQNIAWSILNSLEIIGSWNAQIGNALKKYGVVGHNAFAWLNPAPNFHNKFFTAVSNALNIVSNIDFVAQSIIQGRQAVDEIGKQSTEFQKDFQEATHPTPAEHKPTADAAKKTIDNSQSPAPSNDDLNKVG